MTLTLTLILTLTLTLTPCAQPKRQLSNVPAFGEEAASVPGSPAVVMTHTGSRDDPEVWRPPTPVWPADDYADSPQPYTVSLPPRCLLSLLTCTRTSALSLAFVCSQQAGSYHCHRGMELADAKAAVEEP